MTSKSDKPKQGASYEDKKRFFQNLLTIYGRKPVLECLQDERIDVFRLHLADSNRPAAILDDILERCQSRGIEVCYHDKRALSRISRNSKQDQGIAADLALSAHGDYQDFLHQPPSTYDIIALDRITNPQNLGMIIRSVAAAGCAGLLLPRKGCAALDPLVIKASAGALFRAPLLRCDDLATALEDFKQAGAGIWALSSHAKQTLADLPSQSCNLFVLGNESEGVSEKVEALCTQKIGIAMHNGVESLNVAVTAALLAFRKALA